MEEGEIIDGAWRAFVASRRTATLATTTEDGQARLVPICFVVDEPGRPAAPVTLWTPLDDKPKQDPNVRRLARVRDIGDRPGVTLLFERWSEDWSRLAWLRARGPGLRSWSLALRPSPMRQPSKRSGRSTRSTARTPSTRVR